MNQGGKFKRKDKQGIANFFKADIQIIQRIWKDAMRQIAQGLEVDVASRRKGRCGRKPLEIDLSLIPKIPLNKRSTIRSLAWQLKVNPSTLYTRFKLKQIRRHTSSLKPVLTEKHKKNRVQFCLGMVDESTTRNAHPLFINMHRIVHVDEKWFYMTKDNRTYYLLRKPRNWATLKPSPSALCFASAMRSNLFPAYDHASNVGSILFLPLGFGTVILSRTT